MRIRIWYILIYICILTTICLVITYIFIIIKIPFNICTFRYTDTVLKLLINLFTCCCIQTNLLLLYLWNIILTLSYTQILCIFNISLNILKSIIICTLCCTIITFIYIIFYYIIFTILLTILLIIIILKQYLTTKILLTNILTWL